MNDSINVSALKTKTLDFNPQEHQGLSIKGKVVSSPLKRIKSNSERVVSLMKNFKVAKNSHNQFRSKSTINFQCEFFPAQNQTIKNQRTPKASLKQQQKISSYQLYRQNSKERKHQREKSQGNMNSSGFSFAQTERRWSSTELKNYASPKKISIFQLGAGFSSTIDEEAKVIHINNNRKCSPLFMSLPHKREKKKKTSSSRFTTTNLTAKQFFPSTSAGIRNSDRIGSMTTAYSPRKKQIKDQELVFTPTSKAITPRNSFWQRSKQFTQTPTTKKSINRRGLNRTKPEVTIFGEFGCRPWSPAKTGARNHIQQFIQEETFPSSVLQY